MRNIAKPWFSTIHHCNLSPLLCGEAHVPTDFYDRQTPYHLLPETVEAMALHIVKCIIPEQHAI